MKAPERISTSQKLIHEIQRARVQLAIAESQRKSAKEQARLARRRRKEAKEAARRARKQAKLAKRAVAEAKQVLAEAERKLAQAVKREAVAARRKKARIPVASPAPKRTARPITSSLRTTRSACASTASTIS
ncbi:MAG: hypothetical protein WCK27_08905 [Verrucomicrobiota bacterium]